MQVVGRGSGPGLWAALLAVGSLASTVNRQNGRLNNFYGGYVFVSYFLTGENRPYNRKMGVFDRVRPYEDFFRVRTCDGSTSHRPGRLGSGLSLLLHRHARRPDAPRAPASPTDHTFGLNWYLNPFTRVMFNYVHSIDTYNVASRPPRNRRKHGHLRNAVRDGFLTLERKAVARGDNNQPNIVCRRNGAPYHIGDNVMRTSAAILVAVDPLGVRSWPAPPPMRRRLLRHERCDQCGRHVACVQTTCQVVCEIKKETKTCWCVECQEICPLMPGCHHARATSVRRRRVAEIRNA